MQDFMDKLKPFLPWILIGTVVLFFGGFFTKKRARRRRSKSRMKVVYRKVRSGSARMRNGYNSRFKRQVRSKRNRRYTFR